MRRFISSLAIFAFTAATVTTRRAGAEAPPELSKYVCYAPGEAGIAGKFLAEVLLEKEGAKLEATGSAPAADKPAIIFGLRSKLNELPGGLPAAFVKELESLKSEGYGILHEADARKAPTIWVIGADARGMLFGAGGILRNRTVSIVERSVGDRPVPAYLPLPFQLVTSPAYGMRGHQIGFRNRANSWDAWTIEQMRTYIRDQIIFGANAIENIPFQDDDAFTLAKVSRHDMNLAMSQICADYGIEHWIWTPVEFDLAKEPAKREAEIKRHADFYKEMPQLDGIFFPGGDPGDNPAALVIAFMADVAKPLVAAHPNAKIWVSMQSFTPSDQTVVYDWANKEKPDWFGGIACGPSSPPTRETRTRLDKRYRVRAYPDLTHTVRCQYPVPNWDRAFNLTLGRECINFRPAASIFIHNLYAGWTDGFISYSDGVHDDGNKIAWSLASWNPNITPRDAMIEYCRVFISLQDAPRYADGLLALEKNWEGPITENGAIDATAALWGGSPGSKTARPADDSNWRFQMARFRAAYDQYQRHRQLRESAIQDRVDKVLRLASETGSKVAIEQALDILSEPPGGRDDGFANAHKVDFSDRTLLETNRLAIDGLAEALFKSIQLQTSVPRFKASGAERGCSMDFVDHPLNDRAYYEYRFKEIVELADEKERAAELVTLANWTNPGPGGFYDDIGNIGASPRALIEKPWRLDPEAENFPNTEFTWNFNGNDPRRLAWQDWQAVDAMRYTGLDPKATYRVVATLGQGPLTQAKGMIKVMANGKESEPLEDPPAPSSPKVSGKFGGAVQMKAWRIPAGSFPEGELRVEWNIKGSDKDGKAPRHPEMAEVWLIREP